VAGDAAAVTRELTDAPRLPARWLASEFLKL